MIEKYKIYLEQIDSILANFFAKQEPYIFCKEGCSLCCEKGTYPLTKIEFDYMMQGLDELAPPLQEEIKNNIEQLVDEKKKSGESKFFHACPFLLNNRCSIYQNRAMICRSYGLTVCYTREDGRQGYKIPHCVDLGLNYSNVFDKETNTISSKLWKDSGIPTEPVSFNIDLPFLCDNQTTKQIGLEFGTIKDFLEWFE